MSEYQSRQIGSIVVCEKPAVDPPVPIVDDPQSLPDIRFQEGTQADEARKHLARVYMLCYYAGRANRDECYVAVQELGKRLFGDFECEQYT